MNVRELMPPELVKLELRGRTKDEVMEELASLVQGAGLLEDLGGYMEALRDREAQGSTWVGMGIAIPHGKCRHVISPFVAFGRSPGGVDWDSLDGEMAHLVFMIGVPEEGAVNEHLKILQVLSRRLVDDAVRRSLLGASSPQEVLGILEG